MFSRGVISEDNNRGAAFLSLVARTGLDSVLQRRCCSAAPVGGRRRVFVLFLNLEHQKGWGA